MHSLQFEGNAVEQAQCLLRTVRIGGNVGSDPAALPQILLNLVGKSVDITRDQLQSYLSHMGIAANDVGGALDASVSKTPHGAKTRYFVIHDTSDELPGHSFPADINQATWRSNNLAVRSKNSAHIFINRLGQSATGHNYSVSWRATKRERSAALKGLFLHHELTQPRIKGSYRYNAVAPTPGFTAATMERLALCYVAASLRSGTWMIPAFHCALDLGISDGHDDPQNFDLFQWGGAIEGPQRDPKATCRGRGRGAGRSRRHSTRNGSCRSLGRQANDQGQADQRNKSPVLQRRSLPSTRTAPREPTTPTIARRHSI